MKEHLSWGNQIARLMAALTRVGQGNSPSSAPNSPRHRGHGRGRMDRTTSSCCNSHNGQTGPEQTASACSVSAGCGTGTTGQSQGNAQGLKDGQGSISNKKDPSLLQCFCFLFKVGATWLRSVLLQPSLETRLGGGTKGMWPNLLPAAANSKPPAFPPDPKPRQTILKAAQKRG